MTLTLFEILHSSQRAIQSDRNESWTIPMLCVQAETRFWHSCILDDDFHLHWRRMPSAFTH